MLKHNKRRNLGLLLALSMLVIVTIIGFNTRTSTQQATSTAPAGVSRGLMANNNISGSVAAPAGSAASGLSAPGYDHTVPRNDPHAIRVVRETKHDTSPPLTDMPIAPLLPRNENEALDNGLHGDKDLRGSVGPFNDPVLQKAFGPLAMPTPLITFPGLGNSGAIPPDTQGDIGPNHYVQWINTSFAIYNRSGLRIFGPAPGNTLWSGFGGACQNTNDGDPITLYDQLADRWLMSQFAFPNFPNGPFYQCIAISQTGNPTGQWYRYEFVTSQTKLNDYPHFGVWPDAYYMTANLFEGAQFNWAGSGQYAFDRTRMLAGQTATVQIHELGIEDWGGMMPSDLDGSTLPPTGAPNTFIEVTADEWSFPPFVYRDELQVYQFDVDWSNPNNTTFTGPVLMSVAAFDGVTCQAARGACIPQQGTANRLEAIYDRVMYRLAYRNFGTHESLVFNHTVDADGTDTGYSGIRWYEIRSPRSSPTIFQQSSYAPDASSRWMGSAAMDRMGNMAIGFSTSSSTMFPNIAYAGRLVTDPPNQLAQGEAIMTAGGGSQTGFQRWGDYSMLSLDPTDDCTFWFTSEYYTTSSASNFVTRIGAFRFPSCVGGPTMTPTNTPTPGSPTATSTPLPTNTPTPCGGASGWSAGPDYPSAVVRAVGVYYPGNSRLYSIGGRSSDAVGSDILQPYEYNPATNTWTQKSATFGSPEVNNMAGGVLTIGGQSRIVVVGGSAAGGTTTIGDVRSYDPVADTLTVMSTDAWPPGAISSTLPGGMAVYNNKLYIFGGFVVTTGSQTMVDLIWEFDPARAAGSRWQQKNSRLPTQLGYVPAATIGNFIYTGGGSTWDGTTLQDSANAYRYDPNTDTITTIASLTQATGETRAINWGGNMWVLGGGRTAPNPGNIVQIYNPTTNSWSLGTPFTLARRNFPVDANPGVAIYLAGGYAPTSASANMEIYRSGGSCVTSTVSPTPPPATGSPTRTNTVIAPSLTPTPTRTNTQTGPTLTPTHTHTPGGPATATHTDTPTSVPGTPTDTVTPGGPTITPTETGTPCAITFIDVMPSEYFYESVMYLACHGVITGYADGTFLPYNNTTRGQLSKIVVLAEGWSVDCPPDPTFTDVPVSNPFYCFVETAFEHEVITGYSDGTFRPGNNVTRGQLCKIVVIAEEWEIDTTGGPNFNDVPPTHTFYDFIETAYNHEIISGYADGSFQPGNNATRGQICKIVYQATQE